MMRVALQGSYFGHNFGDVLLLSLYTKWIKEVAGDCEVVLPQATEETVSLIGADSRGFKRLLRSQGLIYAGGGYFGEPPGSPSGRRRWSIRNLYRHMPSGGALAALRQPIAIIGVGAGPLSDGMFRSALRQLATYAVIAAVRDEESQRFLRSIGVSREDLEVTADAALCLSTEDIPEECLVDVRSRFAFRGDNVIGVHLPAGRSFANGVEVILSSIELLLSKHRDIEIVVLSDNVSYDPQVLASRLIARYPKRIRVAQYRDPWTLVALLSELRIVVTTKLHVGIVATAVGTLPLSFPYHHKTERFYRQIGAPELCHPLASLDRERVLQQFELAFNISQDKDYRYQLPHRVREAAGRNKVLVERFIDVVRENAR